jgi:tetratricopeptide (TPR) repeat protein
MATDTRLDLDELARLEEERRFLLRSLADLEREHDAGDIDEADYQTLKDDYTRRAVTVLRAIESGKASFAPPDRHPARSAIVILAVALVAVLGGVVMARAAGLRLPGQSASGNISQSSNDLLVEARGLLAAGKAVDAIKIYDQVLKLQPDNAEALAYRGWLLYQTGDPELLDEGKQLIADAVAADPQYPDAHFFLGFAKREDGDLRGALAEWDAYLALDPPADAAQAVRQSADQVRTQLGLPAEPEPGAPTSSAGLLQPGRDRSHRRRPGLLRRRPRTGARPARSRRRLPRVRSARRAHARHLAEGSPARRIARLHP